MTVFAIILAESTLDNWAKLKKAPQGSYYIVDKRLAFISGKDNDLTDTIAERFGMNDEQEVAGIVLSVDWYNGYHDGVIWEWIDKKRKGK